jgi:uncharacterized membrane protein YfcA
MEYLFLAVLFFIAFLYSSVGHGGASGYLALMSLFGIAPAIMKPSSLTLNVFVSAIAFIAFYKAGCFRWRLVWPFILTSVPFAFLGALISVKTYIYELVLGIFLIFAVGRILFSPSALVEKPSLPPKIIALAIGALLGFFSGMIGIGGGIILSPVLIIFHWANVKESAAASSLFILVNSISGMAAIISDGFGYDNKMLIWIVTGIAGALAGSYIGSQRLNQGKLRYVLAVILLMASLKLFIF